MIYINRSDDRTSRKLGSVAHLCDNTDLREALDLDSMDFLNFVIGLNQRSGVAIPEADYPKLYTIRGIVSYLAA